MAIALVAAGATTAYASRTNITINAPAGLANGHVIYVGIFTGIAGGNPATPTLAGWTQVGQSAIVTDGSGFGGRLTVLRKVASGEGASWTFTHATNSSAGAAIAYSGVDNTTPEDATATTQTATSATSTFPSITTVTDGAQVLSWGHSWFNGAWGAVPAGFTDRVNITGLVAMDKNVSPAAASGSVTRSNGNVSTEPWGSVTIALRPASGGGGGGNQLTTGPQWASGTPTTTGTTWSGATNATGTNNATFATWTNTTSGGTGNIVLSGYNLQTVIGAQPTSVDSISVTVYGYVTVTSRFASMTVQLTSSGTNIGSAQNMTLSATTTNSQTFTFTGVTWAQLAALGVRVSFTRAAVTTAGNGLVDAASVNVTYTNPAPTVTRFRTIGKWR